MRRSKIEVALHFVWATYERMPLLVGEVEEAVYTAILAEAVRLRCEVLAIGGMADHLHLVLLYPNTVTLGQVMKQIKGVSTRLVHDRFGADTFFRWQEGYAVFAFSRSHRERVIRYVQNQKHHHESGQLWPEWEETDEVVPDTPPIK